MKESYALTITFEDMEKLKTILHFLESAEIPEGESRNILESGITILGEVMLEKRGGVTALELTDTDFLRACGIEVA